MQIATPFTIYDAAAGSGKTFTLVKEYLRVLLLSNKKDYYKNLLAITFTNKAVAEMKQRIINNLISFSRLKTLEQQAMAHELSKETGLNLIEIQKKSTQILKHLLHHYSQFSIETIDHFNHRLIRTFARDLKLSNSFEVELNISLILQESINQLLRKISNQNPKITKVLIDFALQKIDEDKSWDISRDIEKVAKLIFYENEAPHILKLKTKMVDDFLEFNNKVQIKKKELSKKLKNLGEDTLQIINKAGLDFSDFSNQSLPTFFNHLYNENFTLDIKKKWLVQIGEISLYTKKTQNSKPEITALIDQLEPQFILKCKESVELIKQYSLVDSLSKNIIPLSVISLVSQEFETYKEDYNVVPISDFNKLIYNEIKNQPTPFIYERLGDKYKHFFIDEFQDTSFLQWQNLIPLIDNALSQQYQKKLQGSLLIVGDAKQSIYRWRGGLPEQFIDLSTSHNPFHAKKEVLNLEINYRSYQEIVKFNNQFFTFLANEFGDSSHKKLYVNGNQQQCYKKEKGYVNIQFIEAKNNDEANELYSEKVLQTINKLIEKNYSLSDICILTRSKKDGITLGHFLLEQGINIISSDILLLQYSPLVQSLIDCFYISVYPTHEEAKIKLLHFIHQHFSIKESKHAFFSSLIKTNTQEFTDQLKKYDIFLDLQFLQTLSLYESCEYCIKKLKLDLIADAYLFEFLDVIFSFSEKTIANTSTFLDYWETQKSKLTLSSSNQENAVKIMTIHKSKGLEFPVVLFPYADLNIYHEIKAKTWFPIDEKEYGFDETLINYNKNVEDFGEIGAAIYQKRRNTLELDNINLLYVSLTRAAEQLYVFCKKTKETQSKSYNQFFKAFLESINLWNEHQTNYEFGDFNDCKKENKKEKNIPKKLVLTSIPISQHNIKLATNELFYKETEKQQAIEAGNLLHDFMSKIISKKDVSLIITKMKQREPLLIEDFNKLEQTALSIIKHPELEHLYQKGAKVYNERDIITKDGTVIRPDRLIFHNNNSVSIVDYKTGAPKKEHITQINNYGSVLTQMNFKVSEKIVIYTQNQEIVLNKI